MGFCCLGCSCLLISVRSLRERVCVEIWKYLDAVGCFFNTCVCRAVCVDGWMDDVYFTSEIDNYLGRIVM